MLETTTTGVSSDTLLLTKEFGEIPICDLENKRVNVWDGNNWVLSNVIKVEENQKILTVNLGMKIIINLSSNNLWYILDDDSDVIYIKKTIDLKYNDIVSTYRLPDKNNNPLTVPRIRVCSVKNHNKFSDLYCLDKVLEKVVFNGVLIGN